MILVELKPTNLNWTSLNLTWSLMILYLISRLSCLHATLKITRIRASPFNVIKFQSSQRNESRVRRHREAPARPVGSARSRRKSASDESATREGTVWTRTFCAQDKNVKTEFQFSPSNRKRVQSDFGTTVVPTNELYRDATRLTRTSLKNYLIVSKSADGKVVWIAQ